MELCHPAKFQDMSCYLYLLPPAKQVTRNVVEPEALAEIVQCLGWFQLRILMCSPSIPS